MDPISLLTTGITAAGSLFGNLFSSQKNQEAQSAENQKNRQFTEYMYNKQVENNIKMWNMQNEYDLPKNMISRMKQAGLNPDLMYSGSGISPAPNLQAATAGSPSTSALPSGALLGESAMQGALTAAQIRNIDADTQKKVEETKGQGFTNIMLMADSEVADAMAKGRLTLQGLDISFKGEANPLMIGKLKADISAVQTSVEEMNQNITESAQRVANMKLDEISKTLDNYIKENSMEYQLRMLAAHCHISEVDAKYAIAKICSELAVNASQVNANNASANASNSVARINNLEWNIGEMRYHLRQSENYYNLELDCDLSELRANKAYSDRIAKREDTIGGNHWWSDWIFSPLDVATNLVGGVFSASYNRGNSVVGTASAPRAVVRGFK